ncbi:MAG TPA: aminoglycoside phosphotransferase family protein [Gemmatimonadales bacterium]|jgi:hypothetical protein
MTALPQSQEPTPRIRTLEKLPGVIGPGLPHDEALPALAALAAKGLGAIPALQLDGCAAEFILRGYTPGDRCALEVRVPAPDGRRFAIKAYTNDPTPEASLYTALADAGLTSGPGVRVPQLLAWEPSLKVLALEWLPGKGVNEIVKDGPAERAGEMGARWLRVSAQLSLSLGPPQDATRVLKESDRYLAELRSGDEALGVAGTQLIESLARSQPPVRVPRLVHGTLYTRHLLDPGGADQGPGIIDWDRFGQGPLELDAGTFLATLWRGALLRPKRAPEASRAEQVFRAETAGLLEERAVAWYEAAALLRLAARMLRRRSPDRAAPLLAKGARLADDAR